jgi:hypothetical protein
LFLGANPKRAFLNPLSSGLTVWRRNTQATPVIATIRQEANEALRQKSLKLVHKTLSRIAFSTL